jgi:hypothetical protein
MLTSNDFTKRAKRRFQKETIENFGDVRIRSLTAREEFRLADDIPEKGDGFDQFATLALWTLVDAKGELLFSHEIGEDGFPVFQDKDREGLVNLDRGPLRDLDLAIKKHLGLDKGKDDKGKK